MHNPWSIDDACHHKPARREHKNITNLVIVTPAVVEHLLYYGVPNLLQQQLEAICNCIQTH